MSVSIRQPSSLNSHIRVAIDEIVFVSAGRMSEGDSVGESIHGKPSAVAGFFSRLGQVRCLIPRISSDLIHQRVNGHILSICIRMIGLNTKILI